jgi:thiol-disulfide isomerase/thioredoxin
MNRRGAFLSVAGVAAALAGVAWQQRRDGGLGLGQHAAGPAGAASAQPAVVVGAASTPGFAGPPIDAFWQSKFTQPNGELLSLAAWRGQPLVLNFWATWCPPCIKEMPEIDRFAREFAKQGGRVLGLAVDNPSAVIAYLARHPVSYAIGVAGFDGTELSRNLGNASGALPFTVAFNRAGQLAQQRLGTTSFEELSKWAQSLG